MTGSVREYESRDMPMVCRIYDTAHLEEYRGENTDFAPVHLGQDAALQQLFEDSQVYVYESDTQVVGFIGCQTEKIIWLYVLPEYQGRGIGGALIDHVLDCMKDRSYIAISVVKSNTPALNLYQKKGFKAIGDYDFGYQGCRVAATALLRN